jgi:glyceraldehyde 3-phosphate dehydrogenase
MKQKTKLGLMGFGRIGRQIYQLVNARDDFEIVAVADVGRADVLHHLLLKTMKGQSSVKLNGNYLEGLHGKTRLLPTDHPNEIPWDLFGVDFVIDATGRFRSVEELKPHLDNGAGRVIISTLPTSAIDRVVLYGVNEGDIDHADRIISAGSASTSATALMLAIVCSHYDVLSASMTSVHAYTSDQRLQDYASSDYRRSRSGATNIIPNETPALNWIQTVLPQLKGKFTAYALNVPVEVGSMLDVTITLADESVKAQDINELFIAKAAAQPYLVEACPDPIVSSDVRGSSCSLVFDMQGTMKAGKQTIKLISWHETLGHAARILDVANCYVKEASS